MSMNLQEKTIAQIQQMPDSLVKEVSDFIDRLLTKYKLEQGEWSFNFGESIDTAESDFADYLSNLEDYEQRLASGEIKW
ncbi:MAG: DUF2281 domain-containing protein [Sphaerospermopsis sp.]|jgi:hypothetical protein|uniref:DUF2281 domain-containing protein n=3 Tax=Sphaerospermopsis TaxID=752201 RepID=A0A480A3C1_9CYAN|nr:MULTISPECIES: DUF2281 domain-containing protein [Sphaerospermopsis]MDB9439933.1 DUF2281 domain-containing protein [Sphaerospermopsis kisseleviana CS-549]MEB3147995.1 DUF2281 domain-containing protein [Sphaerospermopsis sp.]BAZ80891.1 hypothetical protein NIES73_21570 [Sphaerospermopsis kisseleviana NIES-73]GCL38008.1 hypothetical protein SR1949_31210 [Sphaerospermopsis reniformis]